MHVFSKIWRQWGELSDLKVGGVRKKKKITIKISYFQNAKLFKIFLATIFLMLFSDSSHRELLIYRFSANFYENV